MFPGRIVRLIFILMGIQGEGSRLIEGACNHSETLTIREGAPTVLGCALDPKRPATLHWTCPYGIGPCYKRRLSVVEHHLAAFNGRSHFEITPSSSYLRIYSTGMLDEGQYNCTVNGYVTCFTVIVERPVILLPLPQEAVVTVELISPIGPLYENQMVSYSCRVMVQADYPHFVWLLNELPLDYHFKNVTQQRGRTSTIRFLPKAKYNHGVLKCQVYFPKSRLPSREATTVLDVRHAPILSLTPREVRAEEGVEVVFTCACRANPRVAAIYWLMDDAPLPDLVLASRLEFNKLQLTVDRYSAQGRYQCVAINEVGRTFSEVATIALFDPRKDALEWIMYGICSLAIAALLLLFIVIVVLMSECYGHVKGLEAEETYV